MVDRENIVVIISGWILFLLRAGSANFSGSDPGQSHSSGNPVENGGPMVLILDGSSQPVAHIWSKSGISIC